MQEIVAYLGRIDGDLAAKSEREAIRARIAFWEVAAPRLKHLANRLGDQAKPLRIAVHARIQWNRNGRGCRC